MLVNILDNALDALEDASTAARHIVVSATREAKCARIEISDTGPGIPQAEIEAIFDPFFTTKETGRGLGLGLSITYNIIQDFGGHIAAENLASGGARFALTLKLAD